jgi:hypothetical protein
MNATCACVPLRPGTFISSGGLPGRRPLVPRMAQKEHDRRPESLKPEEAAELQSARLIKRRSGCGCPKSSYVFATSERLGSVSKSAPALLLFPLTLTMKFEPRSAP